jgi:hypothetical protein
MENGRGPATVTDRFRVKQFINRGMAIRCLAYLQPSDLQTDPANFRQQFRESLFRLGAFGFDNWQAWISTFSKKESPIEIKLIRFTDTSDVIAFKAQDSAPHYLIADGAFAALLRDVGLVETKDARPGLVPFSVDGMIAQLGDFKIRYGTVMRPRMEGVLLDIEYLPATLLTADFRTLFQSVCRLLLGTTTTPAIEPKFYLPEIEQGAEYSFVHLGRDYMRLVGELSPV